MLLRIDLGPTEVADLNSALAGQDEQLDNHSVFVGARRAPDLDKLTLCQHAIPSPLWSTRPDAEGRIGVAIALVNGPAEEAAQGRPCSICSDLAVLGCNAIHGA